MEKPLADQHSSNSAWSPRAKVIVSVLVTLHVAAVFIAPMSFAVRPGSPAIDPLRALFRPYIQAMFLDHGYAFFAPDPGPSHLVEYRLEFDSDRRPETGRFPNLDEHFPRLLYHRHFMLSESLQTYYVPATAPRFNDEVTAEERSAELARWRSARDDYEALRGSYARHLAFANHAKRAEVHRIRHDFLPPTQFMRDRDLEAPTRMNDERTYTDLDKPQTMPLPALEPREFIPGISPLPSGAP